MKHISVLIIYRHRMELNEIVHWILCCLYIDCLSMCLVVLCCTYNKNNKQTANIMTTAEMQRVATTRMMMTNLTILPLISSNQNITIVYLPIVISIIVSLRKDKTTMCTIINSNWKAHKIIANICWKIYTKLKYMFLIFNCLRFSLIHLGVFSSYDTTQHPSHPAERPVI